MSTVTASILVGNRHRRRGGIQPGWLVLLHEGSGAAWQLVRLNLFEGDEPGALDEAPGVRWVTDPNGDLVGDLALLLQLHLVENAELREMVREVPQLVTRRVADLSALSAREREIYAAALTRARLAEGSRWLSATRLQGSRLDLDALSALPGWSVDLVDQQDRSTLKPNTHWAAEGVDQEAPSDAQTAVSRFVTGVTFNAIATATLSDFLSRAARGPAEETASALQAWSEASLDALERAGAFTEGEAAGLALVIEDLTPHQARLLGALLAQRGSARDAGMSRERLGDQEQQLQDLFVLTARITGHAIALASNRFQLPPWLVIDALDPTTRHALPYYI